MTQEHIGRYKLIREIGRGGMGIIYLAHDPLMNRQVAIKVLAQALSRDPTFSTRFAREIQAIAALDHPGIVPIYDSGTEKEQPYYVMRYMSGGSLSERISSRNLSIEESIVILEDILPALDEAHTRGIIHRDIKPANILFDHRGQAFLSDFGIVKLGEGDSTLTGFNIVGTPTYISPEAANGDEPDGRSDLYAIGVLLFRCWSGTLPYYSDAPMALVMKHIHDPIPNILEFRPELPAVAKTFIEKVMAKKPEDRYPTGEELLSALRKVAAGLPLPKNRPEPTAAGLVTPPTGLTVPNNLPNQASSFIGRGQEIKDLETMLINPDCRLIDLLGPGGIGKTRLSLEVAARQLAAPWQGIYFVPLAPLTSVDLIVPTLAEAIGFIFYSPENPLRQLVNYLREKRLLLVLDNFEHLADGADIVAEILAGAPQVKILVTSRERLNLAEEFIYPVDGMDYPRQGSPGAVQNYAAFKLFVDRAQKVAPDFTPGPEETAAIVRICQLVQGIPLGIELAAAWVRMLNCEEILHEIEESLDFLASSLRNVSQRHRSLRAVFEYSWNLLPAKERSVFAKLALFQGGFNRSAAKAIAGANLSDLAGLVDKSLLRVSGDNWYEMLEVLKQYGLEKLALNPEEQGKAQAAHGKYYIELLASIETRIRTGQQAAAVEEVEHNIENIRLAWAYALEKQLWTLLAQGMDSLYRYYEIAGWIQEGEEQLGRLANALGHDPIFQARARARQGVFLYRMGKHEAARAALQTCVATFRQENLHEELALALNYLGGAYHLAEEYAQAEQLLQESLTLFEQLGHQRGMAISLHHLGLTARESGDLEKAREKFSLSLALNKSMQDKFGVAISLNNLGMVARELGEFTEAKALHQESLEIRRTLNDHWGIANSLEGLGLVAFREGAQAEGRALLGQCRDIYQEIGDLRRLERVEALIQQFSA